MIFGKRKSGGYESVDGGTIQLDGVQVPLTFKHNARARRMILRTDPKTGRAIVTLPPGVDYEAAHEFAQSRAGWILSHLAKTPPVMKFCDGAMVPYLGTEYEVRHVPKMRGIVVLEDGVLMVAGKPEHLTRRLRDWMKAQARREITQRAGVKAEALGTQHGRITIRDTRSRWGSCSHEGNLNFSWRLVMAPDWVLDYVVAHEVAHLVEHNHSPRFWAQVARISDDVDQACAWLKRNGSHLHQYG
jgi:predicted metal-dependent hydrolase